MSVLLYENKGYYCSFHLYEYAYVYSSHLYEYEYEYCRYVKLCHTVLLL